MMHFLSFVFFFFFLLSGILAQSLSVVKGSVMDVRTKKAITNGSVTIEESTFGVTLKPDGTFMMETDRLGTHILSISAPDYLTKRIPIQLENDALVLGTIYLEKDFVLEQRDNLITLTDSELDDVAGAYLNTGLLQATKDVFLRRAAFDFGQAFFRVRGYDGRHGQVLINGLPMNKMLDGRPQWNHWGGLNDVTRMQQFTNGLEASDFTFGGILGNTNIEMRPSGFRPGFRWSSSASNRTYGGRVMATYNSGMNGNRFSYSFSASRRWAKEGFIEGTLYDAYSIFTALEIHPNEKNSVILTGILASNRRGRSSALTEEVFELQGNRYNPYWGIQDGKIRNSRERKIMEPIFMINHIYRAGRIQWRTGGAYQFGTNARGRLGYFNAANPDPTYYRYMPSYYINSPIGANFNNANASRDAFLQDPQLNWEKLYRANKQRTAYVMYDDITRDKRMTLNSVCNFAINDAFQLDFGLAYKQLTSNNYAQISDLLGAEVHIDIDPFSKTRNDLKSLPESRDGDIFSYDYTIDAASLTAFVQLRMNFKKWNAFMAGKYAKIGYQREGHFQNERFPEDSFGKSEAVSFLNYALKGGLQHAFTGRHQISAHAGYLTQAPVLKNVFVNPRENNQVVPDLQSEVISTIDLNYAVRLPKLMGRISGFYTRFQHTTDINFFFVDAGVGSDFVQEVVTGLDKLHMGTELGLEYELSSAVKLSMVASVGKYRYASDPWVSINFDTAGAADELINLDGKLDLGIAKIKNYKLAQGPQQAYAIGLEYRDPKYWWLGVTANFLSENYPQISMIRRTQSFLLDPDNGLRFPEATDGNLMRLLAQDRLDNFYLMNMVGGKSWLRKGTYISVFASINNLFDTEFRTGGYEQGRNGNFGQMQRDNLSGKPSFAPKYWYGYGRTYFLNLAISF